MKERNAAYNEDCRKAWRIYTVAREACEIAEIQAKKVYNDAVCQAWDKAYGRGVDNNG